MFIKGTIEFMIKLLTEFFSQGKLRVLFTGYLLMILIGLLNYETLYVIAFSAFYALPVIFVTYFRGVWHGLVISVFGAAVWIVFDVLSREIYVHPVIVLWNACMILCFQAIITYLEYRLIDALNFEKEYARIDYLTKIPNLRYFMENGFHEIERAARAKHPISVAYLDLDNFKAVNDTKSHHTGDKVLIEVAKALQQNVRMMDFVARVGGDEFVMMFPEADSESVKDVVSRVAKEIRDMMVARSLPVTVSIGVVTYNYPPATISEVIKSADHTMYVAKKGGKNRIMYMTYDKNI